MKRFVAIFLSLALLLGIAGCSKPMPDPASGKTSNSGVQPDPSTQHGLSIKVDHDTGHMIIDRPEPESTEIMGEQDTWTIFVYLCGADLETDYGMATGDLYEMLRADENDAVRFVVQTGGAQDWRHRDVDPEQLQRFVVQGGELVEVTSLPSADMGKQQTFEDFLKWGVENFPADKMGVILWDHGGGSIAGVCFDERYWWDSLSLKELDGAFLSAFSTMTDKFEFVGFDACLMGTVEAANVLASYARYMVASEETEPGSGWDYTAIGDFLAAHPEADGAALGRTVCDSYYAACEADGDEKSVTMSVIDLSRIDALLVAYNDFSGDAFRKSESLDVRTAMVREILNAENFGGNNKADGYTNMVDLGGIVAACEPYAAGGDAVRQALDDAVIYQVIGSDHSSACGLATYYPLEIQGSREMNVFSNVCVSPYYLAFIDRLGQGGVDAQNAEDYDESDLFEGGVWDWSSAAAAEEDPYWDYMDTVEQTGESPLITFQQAPALDDDGTYSFILDANGLSHTANVTAIVYELSEDRADVIELGETYDVSSDWETGLFTDEFDGRWLSLPDGQNLAIYIAEQTEDAIIYSSPIRLNGEETNLRLRQSLRTWGVVIEGTWAGIDENGASARTVTELQPGDEIVPIYTAYELDTGEECRYVGWTYVVEESKPKVRYSTMEEGDYFYAFCVYDTYGDYLLTDPVAFNVESDGTVYFYILD